MTSLLITNFANATFIKLLNAAGAKFIVVGGMAVAAYGCREVTEVDDLDLMYEPTTENAEKIYKCLGEIGSALAFNPDRMAKAALQIPVKFGMNYFDLLTPKDMDFSNMWKNTIEGIINGEPVKICGLTDLITLKEAAVNSSESAEKHKRDLQRLSEKK